MRSEKQGQHTLATFAPMITHVVHVHMRPGMCHKEKQLHSAQAALSTGDKAHCMVRKDAAHCMVRKHAAMQGLQGYKKCMIHMDAAHCMVRKDAARCRVSHGCGNTWFARMRL
eukprot:201213-Amphidinium_carterae.1